MNTFHSITVLRNPCFSLFTCDIHVCCTNLQQKQSKSGEKKLQKSNIFRSNPAKIPLWNCVSSTKLGAINNWHWRGSELPLISLVSTKCEYFKMCFYVCIFSVYEFQEILCYTEIFVSMKTICIKLFTEKGILFSLFGCTVALLTSVASSGIHFKMLLKNWRRLRVKPKYMKDYKICIPMKYQASSVYYIIKEMVMNVTVYKCLHLLTEKETRHLLIKSSKI